MKEEMSNTGISILHCSSVFSLGFILRSYSSMPAYSISLSKDRRLSGIDYAAPIGKCQQMRHRSRKRSKFLKP